MHTALWRRPRGSTPPAPPAGGHALPTALAVPPARRGSPAGAARSTGEHSLDKRLGMGEGSAAGVPWGDGLRKGDMGMRGG